MNAVTPTPTEELLTTISASRLNLWLQCRLKFFFRYVLKLEKPKTPALHVGTTVHSVLQAWNMARWRKGPFQIATMRQVFDNGWKEQDGVKWDDDEAKQQQQAWAMLETFFTETPIRSNEQPEAVEVPVEADLSKHGLPVLRGVLDLVRAGGRIVDFKTTGKTPDANSAAHQHEVQTSSYSVLYRDATGRKESGVELHHLVKLRQPKLVVTAAPPMTDPQQTRLFKQIESYANGVQRGDYVPSPCFTCAGCEYINECRKWS
jgi:PD-(D/E)XK nuclease superfamily